MPAKRHIGSQQVITQNGFRAKQNAERLHGVSNSSVGMYSLRSHRASNTMRNKNKQRTAAAKIAALERRLASATIKTKPKKQTPFGTTGGIIGRAAGSMFGNADIGHNIGKWLGSGIGSIFGSGDYTMSGATPSYNVLTNNNQVPQFQSTKATNVICHREYLGDINGTAGFNLNSYPLNPGIEKTFPWLSTIAQNYQEYRIHGLIFEFRPLITDFVTGGAPGVVIMATNYNADAPLYTSKQDMENSEFAVAVKPTLGLIHGIECATNQTILPQRYIRTGAVTGTYQDLRLYDYGTFQFATQSNPTQDLGELWVSYCVEFFKPQVAIDSGGAVSSGHSSRTLITSASPLGTGNLYSIGPLTLNVTATTVSWQGSPGQQYLVNFTWVGTAASTAPANPTYTGLVAKPYFNGSASVVVATPSPAAVSAGAAVSVIVQCVLDNIGDVTVTLPGTGTYPSTPKVDVFVTELSNLVTA